MQTSLGVFGLGCIEQDTALCFRIVPDVRDLKFRALSRFMLMCCRMTSPTADMVIRHARFHYFLYMPD